MNEAKVTGGRFVVARCQTAGAFELVEAAFDPAPQGVGDGIDEDRLFAIDLARYDRCAAPLFDRTANVITVVATIRDENLRFGKIVIDQRIEPFLGGLSEGFGLRRTVWFRSLSARQDQTLSRAFKAAPKSSAWQ